MIETTLHKLSLLFPSPLLMFRITGATELNPMLIAEIAAIRARSPGIQRSNQNGWHSEDDFFTRTEAGCGELRVAILKAVRQATLEIAPSFDFKSMVTQAQGWINVSGKGAFNAPHDHPGWAWSGTYYVAVPSHQSAHSGDIEFLDPRLNVRATTVDGADCFATKATVHPQPGMLLLFPSYLRHWVYPNEQESDRISIAFNVRFARRMMSGSRELHGGTEPMAKSDPQYDSDLAVRSPVAQN
jgi:uncharacterized protein (TIGR02466 family)